MGRQGAFSGQTLRPAEDMNSLGSHGVDVPLPFPVQSEPPSSMEDLWHALRRMKANRCDDDAGLVAELVQFSPNQILQNLFCLYNSHCSFFFSISKPHVSDTWAWHSEAPLALCEQKNSHQDFPLFQVGKQSGCHSFWPNPGTRTSTSNSRRPLARGWQHRATTTALVRLRDELFNTLPHRPHKRLRIPVPPLPDPPRPSASTTACTVFTGAALSGLARRPPPQPLHSHGYPDPTGRAQRPTRPTGSISSRQDTLSTL